MAMRTLMIVVWVVGVSSSIAHTQSAGTPQLNHFDPGVVNSSLDPCTDFYSFVCSKWLAANPIPADQSLWNTRSDLQIWNWGVLRQAMEQASNPAPNQTANDRMLGDYWHACMNEPGIESTGQRDIQRDLARIEDFHNVGELPQMIAWLHSQLPGASQPGTSETVTPLFGFTATQDYEHPTQVIAGWDQGGLGLPNRDFYLQEDEKARGLRAKYERHIRNMLRLAGETDEQAAADSNAVLAMETTLARAQMDAANRRNPANTFNAMSLAALQRLTPSFDFTEYLRLAGAPTLGKQAVATPQFFVAIQQLLEREPLGHWKAYLKWWTLHLSADYLPKALDDESFDFYGHVLEGASQNSPRWRRCVAAADRDLTDMVAQAYVARAFPPESKRRVQNMVQAIKRAMARDIERIDWMTAPTKIEALVKLNALDVQIGYPDKWRDYSGLTIGLASWLQNVHWATEAEFHRRLNEIGKPANRDRWNLTVPTVDASFNSLLNRMTFPAGLLQPPLFDPDQDDSVNYAAVGMVIGHELSHLFDDQGRKFDADGKLRDWWTSQDAANYAARGQCLVQQATGEVPGLDVKQDGALTLGEDTADNGGLRLALMALEETLLHQGKSLNEKDSHGWTPLQKFFAADAFDFCESIRPEMARTWVVTNAHSLPQFRTNRVIGNFPEFGEAFTCKSGQAMVQRNACRVW